YATGLRAAAARCGPVRLRFTGVSLSPVGVLAAAWPVDGAADRLAGHLKDAMGRSRWSEHDMRSATPRHFAGEVRAPPRLLDGAAAPRRIDPVPTRITTVDLVAWSSERDGAQPLPVTLASAPLTGTVAASTSRP